MSSKKEARECFIGLHLMADSKQPFNCKTFFWEKLKNESFLHLTNLAWSWAGGVNWTSSPNIKRYRINKWNMKKEYHHSIAVKVENRLSLYISNVYYFSNIILYLSIYLIYILLFWNIKKMIERISLKINGNTCILFLRNWFCTCYHPLKLVLNRRILDIHYTPKKL